MTFLYQIFNKRHTLRFWKSNSNNVAIVFLFKARVPNVTKYISISKARGPRSHSADNLSIRPLSKNDCRLLDRFESVASATSTAMGQNWEQDTYETDGELLRVRCLADVATPRLVRGSSLVRGHHLLRQKLTLDNLVKCQPRVDTSRCTAPAVMYGDVERLCPPPYIGISCDDIGEFGIFFY